MTEKLPAQSSRAVISAASRSPASSGFGIGIRSNTTPQVRGSADPLASSPKSLSKVSKIRCSRAAHASTSGQACLAQRFWPTRHRAQLPPGRRPPRQENSRWRENAKSGRARKHFLRAQCIASIGKTREDVLVRNTWIILQNIGFAPSVGHQADHEFDGKSRAAYDGFAREHVRRKRDARMIHDGWLSDPVFRIDITRNWPGTRCPGNSLIFRVLTGFNA